MGSVKAFLPVGDVSLDNYRTTLETVPAMRFLINSVIVSGLTVAQIARAFLVGEKAMEQRITRAKARVGAAGVAFETPGAVERSERLGVVAAMIYLVREGVLATDGAPGPDSVYRLNG